MESGFLLAIFSGLCASLASVSSKLALEGGGKTLRWIVPCLWMNELQCKNVRTNSSLDSTPLYCIVTAGTDNHSWSVHYSDDYIQWYHVECFR